MGFYIYKVEPTSGGKKKYFEPENIRLAGKYGPIASFVQSRIDKKQKEPFTWHMSDKELFYQLGVSKIDLQNRAIIIDLKPKAKEVELYRLRDLWGYTVNDWTPLALHLEDLNTEIPRERDSVPLTFKSAGSPDTPIIEFLYLRGGIKNTNWGWGPVGSVNGVLLWPETLEYFLSVIPR